MDDTLKRTHSQFSGGFEKHKDISLAFLLFVLLSAIYCLIYSGTFITDDEHILASRTLSIGFDDHVNNDRVYGNSRLYSLSTLSPEYAASAVNVEPVQAILGSVLAKLSVLLDVGRVQSIFLLNIGVAAITAVIIFYAASCLGYSKLTAFISAVLFGLSTSVFTFTKTYFRDPLAMLFLAIAWVLALVIGNNLNTDQSRISKLFSWFGLFAGLIAGILTKNTVMIAAPAIGIFLLIRKYKDMPQGAIREYFNQNWKQVILIFVSAAIIFLIWILFVPLKSIFSRFSLEYYLQLITIFFTTPHPNFFAAVIGPLISPGKSIFLYSPILVLALLGSFKKWDIAWPAWFYLLLLIVGQALFYDDEWAGHINWGLRFILPALPPLFIAAIPAIDAWLKTRKGMIALGSLGGLSMVIQVVGALPPMRQFYVELTSIDPSLIKTAAIWKLDHSPIVWHIHWLLSGGAVDLALVRAGKNVILIIAGFLLIMFLVGFSLFRPTKRSLPIISLGLLFGMAIAMLYSYKQDPEYHLDRLDLRAAQEVIETEGTQEDVVVIQSYSSPVWYYWMNWAGQDHGWISLPLYFPAPSLIEESRESGNPEIAMDEATLSLFSSISAGNKRIWLVAPDDTPGAALNIETEWLKDNSLLSTAWEFEGLSKKTKLYLFEFAGE